MFSGEGGQGHAAGGGAAPETGQHAAAGGEPDGSGSAQEVYRVVLSHHRQETLSGAERKNRGKTEQKKAFIPPVHPLSSHVIFPDKSTTKTTLKQQQVLKAPYLGCCAALCERLKTQIWTIVWENSSLLLFLKLLVSLGEPHGVLLQRGLEKSNSRGKELR